MYSKEFKGKSKEFTLKQQVFKLIVIFVIIGILGPFLDQVVLPTIIPERAIQGIETWNMFSSIILGIVATILSIVSLYQSFQNNTQTAAMRENILESLKISYNISDNMNSYFNVKQRTTKPVSTWDKEQGDS